MIGDNPDINAFVPEDQDPSRMLAGVMSPTSAQDLVGPPPDSPPPGQPGVSTQRTGTLAGPPKQAVAKNMDTAAGRQSYNVQPAQSPIGAVQAAGSTVQPVQPVQGAMGAVKPVQTAALNPDPNASLRPGGSSPVMPVMPAGSQPQVSAPSQLDTDTARRDAIVNSRPGWQNIKNPVGRTFAGIGNAILSAWQPGIAAFTPGTSANYQQRLGAANQNVTADQTQADTASQTAERTSAAAKNAALAAADAPRAVTAQEAQAAGNPALEGSMMKPSDIGRVAVQGVKNTGAIDKQDDPNSFQAKNAQSLADVRQTQEVLNKARADAANADPSTPAGKMAIAKLRAAEDGHNSAMVRAQAQMINAQAGAFGTVNGQALPGAMLTDQGQPVGSHFQSNVRPTGQQRGKANMASSAQEQLNDIKAIMQKHATLFGPGYGQASAFKQWVGSQDPDAQRFVAARTIAADHLAGTFGGRSEAALSALDTAIGQFKDNPKAAIAGIDQLTKANRNFVNAGTVKTVGSNAATQPATPAGAQPSSGKAVSLAAARGLPQNKGRSDADITKDIQSHGHQVVP